MPYQGLSWTYSLQGKSAILKMALEEAGVSLERLTCGDVGGKIKRYIRKAHPLFYETNYGCGNENLCMDYMLLLSRNKKR